MKKLYKKLDILVFFFKNEIKIIFRDAGAVLLFLIAPTVYPLLYSTAYENEVLKDIPIATVDLDNTAFSRKVCRMIGANEYLKIAYKPSSLVEAKELFYKGKIKGIILFPNDFEKNILSNFQSNIIVYCDASYFLLNKQVYSGSVFSIGAFSSGLEVKHLISEGKTISESLVQQEPIKVNSVNLYNPYGGYASFVIPGIIIIILQQTLLIGIGMLGGTFREKKLFDQIYKSFINNWGGIFVVLGKALAYVFIYLFNSIITMIILQHFLKLPDNSTYFDTIFVLIPFLFSTVFLVITLSFFFRERVYSLLFMVFLSPVVLFLSGLSWPDSSLPHWLRALANVFPSANMLPAYIKIRITGASFSQVTHEWTMLVIFMLIYFLTACFAYNFAIKRYRN